jgi:hypothetical protein
LSVYHILSGIFYYLHGKVYLNSSNFLLATTYHACTALNSDVRLSLLSPISDPHQLREAGYGGGGG